MKVRNNRNTVLFKDVEVGDVFMYDERYYMRINKVTDGALFRNAVMLDAPKVSATILDLFTDNMEVNKLDAELVINN